MTYIVSSGALNSTHALTPARPARKVNRHVTAPSDTEAIPNVSAEECPSIRSGRYAGNASSWRVIISVVVVSSSNSTSSSSIVLPCLFVCVFVIINDNNNNNNNNNKFIQRHSAVRRLQRFYLWFCIHE